MDEPEKRRMIRAYFSPPSFIFPLAVMALGILLVTREAYGPGIAVILVAGVLFAAFFGPARATDQQIDAWFQEDMTQLEERALRRSGLDRADLENHPVVVVGPIFKPRKGISVYDLRWRKGADDVARFAINSVTIILLGEHFLNSYGCDFNFLHNVALNEKDCQYQYKNVVGVSIGEDSESRPLTTGEKLVTYESFGLSFTSGDRISVLVSSDELRDLTKAEIPTTGVEKAVATIRAMLKSKA